MNDIQHYKNVYYISKIDIFNLIIGLNFNHIRQ